MMSQTKILLCCHKSTTIPSNDLFLPIQVGRALSNSHLDMIGDDEGDNISAKNRNYCELTALYWAWKNLTNIDHIGLCHYRRFFDFTNRSWMPIKKLSVNEMTKLNIGSENIKHYLQKYDIILPKPENFPYSVFTQYCVAHIEDDLKLLYEVLKKLYPEYRKSFNMVMEGNRISLYNMFVAKNKFFHEYCEWIFNIFFILEKEINISHYPIQQRVFGYMAERLLNVYCHYHQLKIKHLPIYFVYNLSDEKIRRKYWFINQIRKDAAFYIYGYNYHK